MLARWSIYCTAQLDADDDKKKALEHSVSDPEAKVAGLEEAIVIVTGEIDALKDGVRAPDESAAEATEQRRGARGVCRVMVSNGAAKELISYAKNRMPGSIIFQPKREPKK